ncbi:hypothetical protein Dda_0792 [Drechslerella dactyloides]|uniref:Uncharacterized protein n=1 Tax=Drechslerella dactyloides TaxID=74499 RepID=A0AAD6J4W9_DREDA|nr:hypothetical protein Dda_0792 [Drechslerella dactyloides]
MPVLMIVTRVGMSAAGLDEFPRELDIELCYDWASVRLVSGIDASPGMQIYPFVCDIRLNSSSCSEE